MIFVLDYWRTHHRKSINDSNEHWQLHFFPVVVATPFTSIHSNVMWNWMLSRWMSTQMKSTWWAAAINYHQFTGLYIERSIGNASELNKCSEIAPLHNQFVHRIDTIFFRCCYSPFCCRLVEICCCLSEWDNSWWESKLQMNLTIMFCMLGENRQLSTN